MVTRHGDGRWSVADTTLSMATAVVVTYPPYHVHGGQHCLGGDSHAT